MKNRVDLKEFVAGFVLEAEEHLHSVNRNLVAASEALKKGQPEPRAVRELFRSLHTIKGLASMVEAIPVVDLSHEMEGILRTADRAGGRLSENALDLLLQGTRAIEERVRIISKEGIGAVPKPPAPLIEALALIQDTQARPRATPEPKLTMPAEILRTLSAADREQIIQASQQNRRAVILEFQPSPEKASQGLNITSVRERLARLGDLIKVIPRSSPGAPTGIAFSILMVTGCPDSELSEASGGAEDSVREIQVAEAETPAGPEVPSVQAENVEPLPDWTNNDRSSIRVDIRRLDDALERLSELVVTRSRLTRAAADLNERGADTRELETILAENSRQLKRLRAAITEARMVPLSELLQRLPLIVRGLTKDTGKSVNVFIQAGSAEVDKAVADRIFPAIVHLIRNAVDHAIESRDERKRAGKPETGTVTVVCDDSAGTSLILTVSDDGRGIDREAVARKAGRPVATTDDELLQQIATAGLSTRESVTHTSGRGMGMDIVRRTVEMLGGTLSLSTSEARGTTFGLRVPVSVTIVDALSFISGDQIFVAPVAVVDEIIEVDSSRLVKAPVAAGDGPEPLLIQRRGEAIPLLSLQSVLKYGTGDGVPAKALVVNQNRGAIAFGVDRMLGQQEVVVRPLNDELVRVTGMAGATDLGDGHPTLVLDLAGLGAAVMHNSGARP